MESIFLANLTSPPLLCFFLGLAAAFLRSDLDVPNQVAKALSIYLLFAIGFKGGVALSESVLSIEVFTALAAALLLASLVPVLVFFIIRRRVSNENAAAIAATFGSISAVTFVTAVNYLDGLGIAWSGHFVAAMALMEAPAIVVGLYLYRRFQPPGETDESAEKVPAVALVKEALVNGSVILIVGSLIIGWVSGKDGMAQLESFVKTPFIGVLCLFLLDMGLVAARRFGDILRPAAAMAGTLRPASMCAFAIMFALMNGGLALALATAAGMSEGDALLLTILGASASYIAVPAAMRLTLPSANPSVYLTMSLAVTFPFNILIGIPLFHTLIKMLAA